MDINKLSNLFSFASTNDQAVPVKQYRADTIEYYVNQIQNDLANGISPQNSGTLANFTNFLASKHSVYVGKNEEAFFLNELFSLISIAHLEYNTPLYLTTVAAIIGIDLGDKAAKANRIARDIINIPPDPNPKNFLLLKKILAYLHHTLVSCTQIIFQPLLKNVTSWVIKNDYNVNVAGYRLLFLLCDLFYDTLIQMQSKLQSLIGYSLQIQGAEVRETVNDIIIMTIRKETPKMSVNFQIFTAKIMTQLERTLWRYFPNSISAAETLTSARPEIIEVFKFQSLPFDGLNSKENEGKIANLLLFPFIAHTTPELFTDDALKQLFKIYHPMMKKKFEFRKEAVYSLGKIIFELQDRTKPFKKVLDSAYSHMKDLINGQELIFGLAALTAIGICRSEAFLSWVFTVPINQITIDAIQKLSQALPDLKEALHTRYLFYINTILGQNDAPANDIITTLKGIKQLDISRDLMTTNFIVSCTRQLHHRTVEVRSATLDFILYYQNQKPSSEIVYRLLTFITAEQDEDLRKSVFSRLRMEPLNPDFCVLLTTYLHDSSVDVIIGALTFLLKLSIHQIAIEYIVNFYQQIMEEIGHGGITGFNAKLFLIFAEYSQTSSVLSQLLEQFAHKLIINFLSSKKKEPASALKLLSIIVPMSRDSVNVNQLAYHIENGLSVHSSSKRLSAAIDLMIVGLQFTNLSHTIYNEHISLHSRLLAASARPAASCCHSKILHALMLVGPIKNTNYRIESKSTPLTARYIVQSTEGNPMQIVLNASVSVVVNLILDVLINDDMFSIHAAAIECLITIMKVHRNLSPELSSQVINSLSELFVSTRLATTSILIANISTIMTVLGDSFSPLVEKAVNLVFAVWGRMDNLHLVRMCEWMYMTVPEPFCVHLHKICTFLCGEMLVSDLRTTMAILSAFVTFGESLKVASMTIIPAILNLMRQMIDQDIIIDDALDRFKTILANCNPRSYFTPVIRAMIELVKVRPSIHDRCCQIIAVVAFNLGPCFLLHVQQLSTVFRLKENKTMEAILKSFEEKTPIPEEIIKQCSPTPSSIKKGHGGRASQAKIEIPQFKEPTIPQHLDEAGWYAWAQEFYDTIIRNSLSRAISACAILAEKHSYIKDTIVPIAFLLYYVSFNSNSDNPRKLLQAIFNDENVPQSILRIMLTSLELFEAAGLEKPVSAEQLTSATLKTEMAAIALRSTEYRFQRGDPNSPNLLIDLYTKLGLNLSARCVLTLAKRFKMNVDELVAAEKIGLWEESLKLYDEKISQGETKYNDAKIRCLEALGRYNEMLNFGGTAAATAYFHSLDIDKLVEIAPSLKDDGEKGSALIMAAALVKNNFEKITKTSEKIINCFSMSLFPLISEDYNMALPQLATASIVQVINEAIEYKKLTQILRHADKTRKASVNEKVKSIENLWHTRFSMIPDDARVLHNFLNTILLVLPPELAQTEITRTANVSIDCKRFDIAEICISLLEKSVDNANTKMLRANLLYATDKKEDAIQLAEVVSSNSVFTNEERSKAELTLSKWFDNQNNIELSLLHAKKAIELCSEMAEAQYQWSLINNKLFMQTNDANAQIESFKGVVKALQITKLDSFEYTLKIISTLFRNHDAISIFREFMHDIPPHVWLGVIPQILCRANIDDESSKSIITDLMVHVGSEHPHVVIYAVLPLLTSDGTRSFVAKAIHEKMMMMQPRLTQTMNTFAHELIRIAVLWWDSWYSTLDNATAITDDNLLIQTIRDLIKETLRPPETANEVSFIRSLGPYVHDVIDALDAFDKNRSHENKSHLWRQLVTVYNMVKPIINNKTEFTLTDASPFLAQGEIDLSVPGTYALGKELVKISKIENRVKIMASKQKPRRIVIVGTNGNIYPFLLKGHEDTRLDERVMQLFKFLNSVVNDELRVTPYEVMPLTRDVGLIGWVPNCTTIFELVKNFRTQNNVNIEEECLESMRGVDYNNLYLDEKVAAFKRGLKKTAGDDLKRILFIRSLDTTHWLERRKTYTASLASTSIFGYILGLGDRHMSNIMMDENTAKLIHIDFGDCFEVAQHRKLFPETVPFRLTRMLVNALEPTGYDGAFRSLCVTLMEVCRKNRTKISGLLEAFVYDPLLQWLNNENQAGGIVARIDQKLSGSDFGVRMSEAQQVNMLIEEATSNKNLCQMFRGWYPWW
ncbi:PIKK family atypical protein kinase [Trichomonas vaginalis G3]|uniref:non-specific serine/threonine protein kinase n=1 Tax=Trichomonas vaginalis (strain ATCC PRA-98 / G3) TaxID=412133 RepID=A2ERB7_TRIV3|nr:ataxia telangiectasia mutated (ATM) -related family [Trichomonas vaginalis G3]EAY04793.1 PIKK family atypical protein kinase [Trichomonas vaginalis G3]KAI5490994.1 ataxia telangiectasia mutated (ATM) -related family [Trichomonas vaginalis G3]|eukprot:XP_001317016.1 PIKK family atypical protein kinase [Trichomonas vaginalis G3]